MKWSYVVSICFVLSMASCTKNSPAPPKPAEEVRVQQAAPSPTLPACTDRHYVVEEGDSFWKIAEKEYGNRGYLGPLIAEMNDMEYETGVIHPGDVLKIGCCLCNLPAVPKKPAKKRTPAVKPVPAASPAPPCPPAPACPAPAPQPAPQPKEQAAVQPKPPPPPPSQPPPAPVAAAPPKTEVTQQQPKPPQPAPASPVQPAIPQPPVLTSQTIPPPHFIVGSLWNSTGQNPIEPGNLVNYSHADVGIIVGRIGKVEVEPYVAINATRDTRGYSWNNKVEAEAGIKLVRPFSRGIIQVGAAYAGERRHGTERGLAAQNKTGPIAFTTGWFGWQQPARHEPKRHIIPGSLPGTFQWTVGNISPFEKNNLIGVVRLDQGVTLVKAKGISLIPTGAVQAGFDSERKPWNNRSMYAGGLKIAIPWKSGVLDVQGGYQCTSQYAGVPHMNNRCGPGFSMNIWTGMRRKIGGE